MTRALIVGIAGTDLDSTSASTLAISLGLSSNVGSRSRQVSGLTSLRIPNADLGTGIEDGGRSAGHSLPTTAEEVVWSRLALKEVSTGFRVGGKRVNHPRADTLVTSVLDSSLNERTGLGLDDSGLLILRTVLLLSGSCLAVL